MKQRDRYEDDDADADNGKDENELSVCVVVPQN